MTSPLKCYSKLYNYSMFYKNPNCLSTPRIKHISRIMYEVCENKPSLKNSKGCAWELKTQS